MEQKPHPIFTIGHSSHSWLEFQQRLEHRAIDVVIDVRRKPYSRYPHFCQQVFKAKLNHIGLSYLHLPDLGGLAKTDLCTYALAAAYPAVQTALELVTHVSKRGRAVLCCAEADPLICHRCLMISPALEAMGASVVHILADGKTEDHKTTERRMMRKLRLPEEHLWKGRNELLAEAYAAQERKIRGIK